MNRPRRGALWVLVVDFNNLELLVELYVETVVEFNLVATTVATNADNRCSGEALRNAGLNLLGDEGHGHSRRFALNVLPLSFAAELNLLATFKENFVIVVVGRDDKGHLIGKVRLH